MNRPRWALGVLSLVATAAVLSMAYACSTSSAVTPFPACSSLLTCCSEVPAAEQAPCAEAAGSQDEMTCATLLTTYSESNVCASGLLLPDGSPAEGSCASLASCCKSVPAVEQASCNSVVSLGLASSCATTLTGLMQSGECSSGGGSDAGPVSFSGPSCPPGAPPNGFVGADASTDCVKCANNCLSTNTFGSDCSQYYGCFCPCAANDTGCQQACLPLAGDCMDTQSDVESCITSDCASLCTAPSTGTVGCIVTGGFGADAGTCDEILFGDAGAPGGGCSVLGVNGMAGTCPSANLTGCCARVQGGIGTIVECYYDPSSASADQSACSGTWTTTLP